MSTKTEAGVPNPTAVVAESPKQALQRQAEAHLSRGDAVGWFEPLYAEASGDATRISWADLCANPHLVSWIERGHHDGHGQRALVVGCGLGDDAEYLARCGWQVTAFDVAPTAVEWCRQRFPESHVDYQVADVFDLPPSWHHAFQLVVEVYTLQVIPAEKRRTALAAIAQCAVPDGGAVVVICRGRSATDPPGHIPWPLTREEIEGADSALKVQEFADFFDEETPPVRRFRAVLAAR